MKSISRTFFIFCLILPTVALAAGNFGIRPAYPSADNPRTESIFIHEIEPGQSAEDGVKVINGTDLEKTLLLYTTDSAKSSGGAFACSQLSDKKTDVGSWVKFDTSKLDEGTVDSVVTTNQGLEITIPSNSEIIIPFRITVPNNSSVGEHNGCIVVQEIKERAEGAPGISLTVRSGIRVAITVPGEVKRELKFIGFSLDKDIGAVSIKTSVENTGNVSIDTQVAVKVKHFFGVLYKEFGGQFPVLRGDTSEFTFKMKKPLLGGVYFAKAVFSYDQSSDAKIGVNTDAKLIKLGSDSFWFVLPPRITGIVVWLVILFALWFIWNFFRYKKQQKKIIASWPDYLVKEGDTLESVSKMTRLPWRFIVKVNKLKPPYILEKGRALKVPPRKKK